MSESFKSVFFSTYQNKLYGAAQQFPLPVDDYFWVNPRDYGILADSWESWTGYEVLLFSFFSNNN